MARKVAFVTGASNVTGKAMAIEFAKAGYDVGFTYTSNEDGAKRTQKEIESYGADVYKRQLRRSVRRGCCY